VAEHKDLASRLSALTKDGVEFSSVQIVQVPVRAGVAQHHSLVYWYERSASRSASDPLTCGLQLDWGSDGLAFSDLHDKPTGRSVVSKDCGLLPVTVAHQVSKLVHKVYNLVQWNCQHFSLYLFDRAWGNSQLNAKLQELQADQVSFVSAGLYHEAVPSDYGDVRQLVLAYFYTESSQSSHFKALRLDWGTEGLTYRIIDSNAKTPFLEEPVRSRNCGLAPQRLLDSLREIEGWKYEASTWNHPIFIQHLFKQVLAKGGQEQLYAHLDAQGLDFLQFSFRWMNCLLLREFPLHCVIRLWDAYIAEPSEGFSTFHVYVCAVFLIYWSPQLKQMDFQQLMLFMQKLPTGKWRTQEIETLLAEAYVLKSLFHSSPKHLVGK
jgi:hypothetical protein